MLNPLRPALVLAVLGRPRLWATAWRQLARTVPSGWWRQRPFLPVPAAGYVRFRAVTQYGDPGHRPEVDDVLNYLAWCRDWDRHDGDRWRRRSSSVRRGGVLRRSRG